MKTSSKYPLEVRWIFRQTNPRFQLREITTTGLWHEGHEATVPFPHALTLPGEEWSVSMEAAENTDKT